MAEMPAASVLLSTYNAPEALAKVLTGYFVQTRRDFEIIIADDGSGPETAQMLAARAAGAPVPIIHVWQPDTGFGKCRILNKAMALARGARLIVSDGDCVPRRDFVAQHLARARPGTFLAGGYFKLPQATSDALGQADIESGAAFAPGWLRRHGVPTSEKLLKLVARPPLDGWLNRASPAKRSWNGQNSSCARADALAVNGFNEEMEYGGLDVEFGLRLMHAGLVCVPVRYSAIVLHLHHGHGYVTEAMLARSAAVKARTRAERLQWAERGVAQWLAPDGAARLAPDDGVTRL